MYRPSAWVPPIAPALAPALSILVRFHPPVAVGNRAASTVGSSAGFPPAAWVAVAWLAAASTCRAASPSLPRSTDPPGTLTVPPVSAVNIGIAIRDAIVPTTALMIRYSTIAHTIVTTV